MYYANVSLSIEARVFVKGMPTQSRSQTIFCMQRGNTSGHSPSPFLCKDLQSLL